MALTNAYADVDQFLDWCLRTVNREQLAKAEMALNAASRQIDHYTGWSHGFWQDDTVKTREFYADDSRCCYVPEGISTTTGLIVKTDDADDGSFGTTLTISTHFILQPVNAADQTPVEPFTEIVLVDYLGIGFPMWGSGRPGVQVTAKFGWPVVPVDVTTACLIQAETIFKASGTGVIQAGLDGIPIRSPWMNPSAAALLEGFCRPRVA